ncbi:hypothetical protein FACS1894113_5390 [Alphaproteobacteria bacterium]|nr:hypothetical protein FACS1894113_5390 [Alphaproteobacteria bacterium]
MKDEEEGNRSVVNDANNKRNSPLHARNSPCGGGVYQPELVSLKGDYLGTNKGLCKLATYIYYGGGQIIQEMTEERFTKMVEMFSKARIKGCIDSFQYIVYYDANLNLEEFYEFCRALLRKVERKGYTNIKDRPEIKADDVHPEWTSTVRMLFALISNGEQYFDEAVLGALRGKHLCDFVYDIHLHKTDMTNSEELLGIYWLVLNCLKTSVNDHILALDKGENSVLPGKELFTTMMYWEYPFFRSTENDKEFFAASTALLSSDDIRVNRFALLNLAICNYYGTGCPINIQESNRLFKLFLESAMKNRYIKKYYSDFNMELNFETLPRDILDTGHI